MVCPHEQGRFSQCGQGGKGQFFAILCGRLLWTASYGSQLKKKEDESQYFNIFSSALKQETLKSLATYIRIFSVCVHHFISLALL